MPLYQAPNPQADFAKCVAALRENRPQMVTISARSSRGSVRQTSVFQVATGSNGKMMLRIQEPALAGADRSDRAYYFQPGTLTGIDYLNAETLVRKIKTQPTRALTIAAALGQVPEPVKTAISPEDVLSLAKSIRKDVKWKLTVRGSERLWTNQKAGVGKVQITFGANRLVRQLTLQTNSESLAWSYAYGKPIAVTVPSVARMVRVTSFTVRPALGKFADKDAERVVRAMLNNQPRQQPLSIRTESGTLHIARNRFGEDRATLAWRFDGRNLFVLDKKRRRYSAGQVARGNLIATVRAISSQGMDPYLRLVIARQPLFRDLFPVDSKIQRSGQLAINGVPHDLVTSRSIRSNHTLMIRRSDSLVSSIESETLGVSGRAASRSRRTFSYAKGAVPKFELSRPAGYALVGFPRIK